MAVAAETPGFLFGGDTGMSYDQLQKRRAVLEAVMARQAGSAPKNVGEGIYALGQGLVNGLEGRRLRLAEEDMAKQGAGINADIAGMVAPPAVATIEAPTTGPIAGFGSAAGPIADATTSPAPIVPVAAAADISPVQVASADPSRAAATDWLKYENQGATRNKPLQPELVSALGFLPEMGISMEVFSGGQDGKGEGGRRTGSVRHDHGGAADVFFQKDGRRIDWANPEDRPLFQEIVSRAKANGVTGFGAGDGYMRPGSMHIGFGAPSVWGAGGSSANAPDWLKQAYAGAPARLKQSAQSALAAMAKGGQPVQVASADPSFMPQPSAPNNLQRVVPSQVGTGPAEIDASQIQGVPQAASPVQTAGVAAPSVAPMPAPQTVAANPIPADAPAIAMDDPRFDPRTSPEMRQAMISGDFDGLGFKSAQAANTGAPSIPADPIQRVAAAMSDRGILPASTELSPAVRQVGGAVMEAQARQGQPPQDPRIGMAMRVMQNPAASPEQKAIATTVLQGAMEERRQAEERGYETQQAERNRQNGLADYRTKLELDAQYGAPPSGYRRTGQGGLEPIPGGPQDPSTNFKPNLQSVYIDGREQKGYFDAANKWTPLGDPKAPSSGGGVTVLPDGTVQVGGGGVKVPANFMPDPNNPGAVTPIPGGPGEQISGELAARLGLANEFLQKAPELRKHLESGEASGPIDVFQARNNQSSSQAGVHRELEYGVEALVRMLTGAGMNASEADERARRYLPTYTDDASSMTAKLDGLTEYLKATKDAAMLGRGGAPGALSGGQQKGGQTDYRSRYGLE